MVRTAAAGAALLGVLIGPGALPATARRIEVSTPARAELWPGGQVRLSPSVRCPSGSRVTELYVQVSQAGGAAAQAYRVPAVSCDGARHRVPVRLPTVTGQRLRPGTAAVEALLYVQSGSGPPTTARAVGPAVLAAHGQP